VREALHPPGIRLDRPLVQRRVALIVAGGLTAALAAKAATVTIPIVFSAASDPVKAELVSSLARPGGNAAGVAGFSDALISKRLEILRELVPSAAVVGLLINPSAASAERQSGVVQTAAQTLGVQIRIFNVENQEQFDAVFARAVHERINAILVPASTVFSNGQARLVALAALHAMPAIYEIPDFVAAGGLISYGSSRNAGADGAYQQVGVYAGRILKGERPADLPVLQAARTC
jgi:putative tryptophan/tyrosine transport system substrate-binding protein